MAKRQHDISEDISFEALRQSAEAREQKEIDFHSRLERYNFEKNDYKIIATRTRKVLPIDLMEEMQAENHGLKTTRFGFYVYTQFAKWQDALEFYEKFHRKTYKGYKLLMHGVADPELSYDEMMEKLEKAARRRGCTLVTKPVGEPPICH